MSRTTLIIIVIALVFASTAKTEPFYLTENNLVGEIELAPEIDRIELDFLNNKIAHHETLDDYSLTLNGEVREEHTNEQPVNDASFIQERRASRSLGITQALPYGITLGAGYSSNKNSTIGFSNNSQSKLTGRLSLDLLKDFLGRTSLSELRDVEIGVEAAKLSRQINKKVFRLRLRRLYWDYLAAYESKLISKRMLESDKKELSLVREKLEVDAADEGDVARLASQVSERTAQSLRFEGTMKEVEVDLRQLLPQLKGRTIKMGKYDRKLMVKRFYSCLDFIGKEKTTPLQHSLFDELVELKRKQLSYRRKAIDSYSDIDLTLDAEAGIVGSEVDSTGSFDDLKHDKDSFAAVGLRLEVPLDGKRKHTEELQLKAAEREFQAESKELIAQLDSFHETIIDAISLIRGVIDNRLSNSDKLTIALEDSRTKYRQARITSQQLLQEQDRYFSNELDIISTQRDLIQIMLDYFALFTDTPCELNRVN